MGREKGAEEEEERCCELCAAPAAVHCAADAAFLCAACDAKVHGANFLASRHRRTRISAAAPGPEDDDDDDGYESAASSCVSTADTAPPPPPRVGRRPRRPCAEAVLEGWAKQMGLPTAAARRRAERVVRACGPDSASASAARVPPRVAMAAALWREVAAASPGASGCGDALRRLEACAHVPARLVVAVASSMARARARSRARAAEGWDECSWAGPKKS